MINSIDANIDDCALPVPIMGPTILNRVAFVGNNYAPIYPFYPKQADHLYEI